MTEYRIRCSGKGRNHQFHVYTRTANRIAIELEYLEKQPWTVTCRPFLVETRQVGEWQTPAGPPVLVNVGEGEWINET